MLYFVKRNKKIQEYKKFHDRINRILHLPTDKMRTELLVPEVAEFLIQRKIEPSDENNIESIRSTINELKRYEPYESRIDFSTYKDLFNFEDYIYRDKLFSYNSISRFNKRLMPDFLSSVYAEFINTGILTKNIRRNIEQYLFAIMSDMDYINMSNTLDFVNDFKETKNIFIIIGSTPTIFSPKEKETILSERCDIFFNIIKQIEFSDSHIDVLIDQDVSTGGVRHKNPISLRHDTFDENKQTVKGIQDLIKKRDDVKSDFNLIVISSSFNLLKCAIEIEKLIQRQKLKKPDNILLVGGKKIYDKIKPPAALNFDERSDNQDTIINTKKVKSLIYEVILHNLDRNAIK